MSTPVRRSSRLRAKEEEKKGARARLQRQSSSSSSYEEEEEEEDDEFDDEMDTVPIAVTPSSSKRTAQKANNFTKVYSSYNKDYGLDVYEGDFIDDRGVCSTPSRCSTKTKSKRSIVKRKPQFGAKSSSSSKFGVEKKSRKRIVSSDEESTGVPSLSECRGGGEGAESGDSDVERMVVRRRGRRRRHSSTQLLSSSEEEEEAEEEGGGRKVRKHRRLELEIEDEIEETTTRKSSRAKKLREDKEKKSEEMFKKLRESRTGRQENADVSNPSEIQEGENWTQFFVDMHEPGIDKLTHTTLAEKILFPASEDSDSSEESDWIVSDGDGPVDWREELAQDDSPKRFLYHPEAHLLEAGEKAGAEDPMLQELVALPLVEAVCGEEGGVEAVRRVLSAQEPKVEVDAADEKGYTALMYAAEKGSQLVLELLLSEGASTGCKDGSGTTALHLAALGGWLDCVDSLIAHGHEVDCRDDLGWPPLLYAHFQNHQDCVLALMKAKPKQLSVLGDLLKQPSYSASADDNKKKTLKVIRSLLVSLAHEEAYYSLFNDFISHHPSVLEEDGFSFLKHCTALLSFENKRAWFKNKLSKLRDYAGGSYDYPSLALRNVSRDDLLGSLLRQLRSQSEPILYWRRPLHVSFQGEAGICLGPRREFFACLAKALARGDEKLFKVCDNSQLSLQPCHVLSGYCGPALSTSVAERHDRLLESVAMIIAHAIFHGDTMALHLSNPIIKQLLGLPLEHPGDLESVDKAFHHSLLGLLEIGGEVEDLELTFTQTVECPWSGSTVDLPLSEGGRTKKVTDQNKADYVEELSRFKLEGCISHELKVFTSAFWKILPRKSLEVFTPSELVLLMSGVPEIDVQDWRRHTKYRGLAESGDTIQWFWRLVESLKEEEKALLLKFVTGSPCLPAGGFSCLQGLAGMTHFTITIMPGKDKVPHASTCFNTLKLSDYSSEQQFRNKLLIAIRYGCEGFEFS